MPEYTIREQAGYRFVEEGPATDVPPVVMLHGMMGDYSNWGPTIDSLRKQHYRVLVPILPIYDLPLDSTTVSGFAGFVRDFTEALDLERVVLAGNSLGGHVALLYAIRHPETVAALVLAGASGIYEVEMGTSVFRRKDREELRQRTAFTFYDPVFATEALVDEVYDIVNDRRRALRLIRIARAVQAEGVAEDLSKITAPTLLVWGRDDRITPPDVANIFSDGIPDSRLHFLEECGHAPMMEQPDAFNRHFLDFLNEVVGAPVLSYSD